MTAQDLHQFYIDLVHTSTTAIIAVFAILAVIAIIRAFLITREY